MSTWLYGFLPQLLIATWLSIRLALCALILGLFLGILGASIEMSRLRLVRLIGGFFITLIRGLPELLVIFCVYFGAMFFLSKGAANPINISPFWAGVVALGLLFGAYASQAFRGAFLVIPPGQAEAAAALGFTPWQIFWIVSLPQAWRHALPGLSNLWLVLLKDTALVSLIGLSDLMSSARLAASTTHKPFTFYLAAAALYLTLTSVSHTVVQHISQKTNPPLSRQ